MPEDQQATQVPIWARPEPPSRPTPTPLSRERIVATAIDLADEQGLAAVSLRNVASALGAGPMRLYGYLSTKDDLLDLMVDHVFGQIELPGQSGVDWRADLTTIAHGTRRAVLAHPWFVVLVGGRPRQGPNTLRHLEASFAALSGTGLGMDDVMTAAGAVNSYVLGALGGELGERHDEQASGQTEEEWQRASAPYMAEQLATGRFPTLGRLMAEAGHPGPDVEFERGLAVVLAGVASLLADRM